MANSAAVGVIGIPDQTGNSGKYLKTDGSAVSFDQLDISTADISGAPAGLLKGSGGVIAAAVSGADIKTVSGVSLLGSGNVDVKISNIVNATTNTTLTTTPTILNITPAGYGVSVTLPNATTCTVGGPLYIISNKGSAYSIRVINNSGVLIGFVPENSTSFVSVIDNTTANGIWNISGTSIIDIGAKYDFSHSGSITGLGGSSVKPVIDLGTNRELLVGNIGTASITAIVYNKSTNTFGSPVTVRSGNFSGELYRYVLAGTDKVLVTSCTSGTTNFEAVVLSISDTTITVNTAATATLSGSIGAFVEGGLVAIPSISTSFVVGYSVSTNYEIRAISISGTTVTIGAATVLEGTATNSVALIQSVSDKVIAASCNSTTMYTKPYTVSGSSLSAGTGTSTVVSNTYAAIGAFFELNGYYCILHIGTNNYVGEPRQYYIDIVTLSGTTTTISTVNIFNSITNTAVFVNKIGTSKVLCLGSWNDGPNCNIVTNTTGTASMGTPISLTNTAGTVIKGGAIFHSSGTDAYTTNGTSNAILKINCSGTSPSLTGQLGGIFTPGFAGRTGLHERSAFVFYYQDFVESFGYVSNSMNSRLQSGAISYQFRKPICNSGDLIYRGSNDTESWIISNGDLIKVELATGLLV